MLDRKQSGQESAPAIRTGKKMASKTRAIATGLFCSLALGAAALIPAAVTAAPHAFTPKDMAMMERVSDPHISPDGTVAVYDLRTTDWAANKGAHAIWLVDLKTHQARRLAASDGGASSPRWSADGKWIYFVSGRSGSDQVWRTDRAGASAEQVTKLPLDVQAYKVSPAGGALVVALAVFPDCADLNCTKARMDAKAVGKASGVVFDHLFVRHWDAWADGTRNALFTVALGADGLAGAGEPIALMRGFDGDSPSKPFGDDGDYAVTPDGKTVIFSAKADSKSESWTTNFDLFRAPADGSAPPQNLTAANQGADETPVVSPDGTKLAWRAQKRAGFESDRHAIMVMDLATGAAREVDPAWDRSADKVMWAPDGKSLYVIAEDVGQTRLFSLDLASGKARPMTGDGHVPDFDVSGRTVLYVHDQFDAPAQLFLAKGKGGVQITDHNAEALKDIAFGGYEQFAFPGWNGETVHGYVVKPVGYDPAKTYPVAFLIHGGPQGSFGNLFHYRWNAEAFAGAGYAVVMIDFHGSTGYGQAFTDAISQHWGDRPLEDLQKGWAYALAKYPFLDGGRTCALGGSYGGFMVNWIAGNWKGPWKCLVDHDGLFDNRMMGYSTEELWFSEWENGSTPWDHPADYERFNPVDHVADWSVPEMVVHSAKDFRIPLDQGLATFGALQRKGVPSQLLYYPDENHWVQKPQNNVEWHETIFAWLNRWTAAPGS